MKVIIVETAEEMSAKAADIFAERIRSKPDLVIKSAKEDAKSAAQRTLGLLKETGLI